MEEKKKIRNAKRKKENKKIGMQKGRKEKEKRGMQKGRKRKQILASLQSRLQVKFRRRVYTNVT